MQALLGLYQDTTEFAQCHKLYHRPLPSRPLHSLLPHPYSVTPNLSPALPDPPLPHLRPLPSLTLHSLTPYLSLTPHSITPIPLHSLTSDLSPPCPSTP
ncbi:hypothetical protein Pcinc_011791 [Petrolisthes cinctipes]|uniref:Uncharacterized protein n=1 Tax=Petrolisthes cinctipes TaxID=88211 RepID=A0AAE1G042_PETCI|nr:hypothetical protein Pcinc_011791 [Petrolisthes cinctipes]